VGMKLGARVQLRAREDGGFESGRYDRGKREKGRRKEEGRR
jgi:hypothetical protein